MNSSHALAANLIALGEWLKSRPEFPVAWGAAYVHENYTEREQFIAAVKACGSGTKTVREWTTPVMVFKPTLPADQIVLLEIDQSTLCRLIQPAVYDCPPLLADVPEEAQP